jgi:GNAT superfamily N-acetyltransferase
MSYAKATVTVVQTEAKYARRLAKMQSAIFPTLTEEEILSESQYLRHIELFPEGQLTALVFIHDKWVAAGSTSTFLTTWNYATQDHTFLEVIGAGWFTHHDPNGDWIYGGDLSVHPDFHSMGVGSALYKARQRVVHNLNLKGEIAGGMIPGYYRYRDQMSIEAYAQKVSVGELFDPTLSVQVKNGFKIERILHEHITDPRADNCAAMIVRPNPHYREERGKIRA